MRGIEEPGERRRWMFLGSVALQKVTEDLYGEDSCAFVSHAWQCERLDEAWCRYSELMRILRSHSGGKKTRAGSFCLDDPVEGHSSIFGRIQLSRRLLSRL